MENTALNGVEVKVGEIATAVKALHSTLDDNQKKNDGLLDAQAKELAKAIAAAEEAKQIAARVEAATKRMQTTESKGDKEGLKLSSKKMINSFARHGDSKMSFASFVNSGAAKAVDDKLEVKYLSEGIDIDGGYAVMPQFGGVIEAQLFETSPLRSVANVVTIGTQTYEVLLDDDEASGGWVGEIATRSETDTPQLAKKQVQVHEIYAKPKATNAMLEDGIFDMENWLLGKVADIISRTENTAFVSGNGVGKPFGFTSYSAWTSAGVYQRGAIEQINSGTAGAITADGIIKLLNSLKETYQSNATFMMKRASYESVLLLKDGTGRYLVGAGDMNGAPGMTLRGRPIVLAHDMPAVASAALSVAVGDFRRGYTIVDRRGMQIIRDPYTASGFTSFYCSRRTGGDVVNFEAIKLLKLSA